MLIRIFRIASKLYWRVGKRCSTLPLLLSNNGGISQRVETGLTNYERQSASSRQTAGVTHRWQREEALPEAGIPLRTGFRDSGFVLHQDRRNPGNMPGGRPKNFLMLVRATSATRLSWSTERAALVAEALRCRGGSSQRVRLQVYGESMLPRLWPGDIVEIANCLPEDLRTGEIVLAMREDRFFLHRLVAPCTPNGFELRGDSMPGPDPIFPPEALLGRLVPSSGSLLTTTWFGVAWSRAWGMLFCHFSFARRVALRLHGRRKLSASKFRSLAYGKDLTSAQMSSAEPKAR